MSTKMICISCPIGCHLTVDDVDGNIKVEGNRCPRGIKYATDELIDPRRMVTGVVACDSELTPYLPIRTSEALRKKHIASLLAELRKIRVSPPVAMGDVVIADFAGTGVDVLASRSVKK